MSEIEYNNLVFEISKSLEELNLRKQLLFLCRGKLAAGSEDVSIQDVLSLFKELEQRNHLGPNRLGVMKDLLKSVKEWVLLGKVKKFESKRKEYLDLLEQIIPVLDELNDLERLISICRVEIPEANEANIPNVRSLLKELEIHSCLGIDCLDILKEILTQTEQSDLLKEVDKFEERRNREDDFETRKGICHLIFYWVISSFLRSWVFLWPCWISTFAAARISFVTQNKAQCASIWMILSNYGHTYLICLAYQNGNIKRCNAINL